MRFQSLKKSIPKPDANLLYNIAYNTGTVIDILLGNQRQVKIKKEMHELTNGGFLFAPFGLSARNGYYKSTLAGSLIVRTALNYPGSDIFVLDCEFSIARDRMRIRKFDQHRTLPDDNLELIDGLFMDMDQFYDFLENLCAEKEKNKKDFQVESPFINAKTGKPFKVWIPTFVFIDSYSALFGAKEEEMLKKGVEDSTMKTIWMQDGGLKTILFRKIVRMAHQHGICFILTAHVDKSVNMSNTPQPKEFVHGKMNEDLKRVGSLFKWQTIPYCQNTRCKTLQDSKKEAKYPEGKEIGTGGNDIQEVMFSTIRCKTNYGGQHFPCVVSQSKGLLSATTNYHYLKENGLLGMSGSVQRQQLLLYPDVTLRLGNIRTEAAKSYELRRALDITARYAYVKNTYHKQDNGFQNSIEEFCEKVYKLPNKDEILNSRSYWTYKDPDKRKYLSIFDIAKMIKKKKKNIFTYIVCKDINMK